jgi:hypothetical protein
MNKMEQLFQEQRRNLLNMMMLAKQGLPPTMSKVESLKQPLKEQNNTTSKQQPKRSQEVVSAATRKLNADKKKKQKHDCEDVNF